LSTLTVILITDTRTTIKKTFKPPINLCVLHCHLTIHFSKHLW
jgi:hypothetical protein